jgi:hypothetical protein
MGKSFFRKLGNGLVTTSLGGIGELKGMEPLGKLTRPIRKEAEGKIPSIVAASTLATTGNPVAAAAAGLAVKKSIDAKESYLEKGIQTFKTGGTIKGKKGKPTLILAHAGETVIPLGVSVTKGQKDAIKKLKSKK